MKTVHTPVMLHEVLHYLSPAPGKTIIDATVGGAGHTLSLLATGAHVIGLDQDTDILEIATARVKEAGYSDLFTPIHSNFSHIAEVVKEPVDGILFDLGVSSYQLDTPERGFSFRYDAPLDMRMDQKNQAVTAADLINGLGKKELGELFIMLGEEYRAKRLVEVICDARKRNPIKTTFELVKLIENVLPRTGKIHPATKIFQALRMAVNSEREELKAALPSALSLLSPGGTIVVLSFHSLEDKIVKEFAHENLGKAVLLSDKPMVPSDEEIFNNPRSRSAKLRAIRKES